MIVKCLADTGKYLRKYDNTNLLPEEHGLFGVHEHTQFPIETEAMYFVTGMVMSKNQLLYLIDAPFRGNQSIIGLYPYQLFTVIDHRLPSKGWFFNTYALEDAAYQYTQAIWGYHEWCFDLHNEHYEGLIDMDEHAHAIFYKRKKELQDSLNTVSAVCVV